LSTIERKISVQVYQERTTLPMTGSYDRAASIDSPWLIFRKTLSRMQLACSIALGSAPIHISNNVKPQFVSKSPNSSPRAPGASLDQALGVVAAMVNYNGTNRREMAECFALPKQLAGQC